MKKIKYLIFPILLLISFSVTYAIFSSSKSGSGNVSAANWLVKLETIDDEIDITGGRQNINFGLCEKFMPGNPCVLPLNIDATLTEVDTVVTLEIGEVTGATKKELDAAGVSFKISDGVNEGYSYNVGYRTKKNLNLVIDWELGNINDEEKTKADLNLSKIQNNITVPVNIIAKQIIGENITITFNSTGGNVNIFSKEVIHNSIYGEMPIPTKMNYSFIGWNTKRDGTGNYISYDSLVTINEPHTLYAIWDRAYASSTEVYNRFHNSSFNYIKCDVNSSGNYYNCSNSNNLPNSNDKSIIVLNKDLTQDISLTSKDLLIDLYGNSLTGEITIYSTNLVLKSTSNQKGNINLINNFVLKNSSNLEFENVSINLTNNAIVPYSSTVTLRNSEIIATGTGGNSNLWMRDNSTANLYNSYIYGPYAIGGQGGTININDSILVGSTRTGVQINSDYCGDITINGNSSITGKMYGIYIMQADTCNSTLQLNGSYTNKPYIKGIDYSGISIKNTNATFTFNYGDIYGKNNIINNGISIYRDNTTLVSENIYIDEEQYIHTYLNNLD